VLVPGARSLSSPPGPEAARVSSRTGASCRSVAFVTETLGPEVLTLDLEKGLVRCDGPDEVVVCGGRRGMGIVGSGSRLLGAGGLVVGSSSGGKEVCFTCDAFLIGVPFTAPAALEGWICRADLFWAILPSKTLFAAWTDTGFTGCRGRKCCHSGSETTTARSGLDGIGRVLN
jgi:hypothetical protein